MSNFNDLYDHVAADRSRAMQLLGIQDIRRKAVAELLAAGAYTEPDNIDAKITQSRSLFGALEAGGSGWSPYQKSLDRQLFLAPKTPAADPRKPHAPKRAAEPEAPRLNQCSLH